MQMKPPALPLDYVPAVTNEELITALELIRHATAPEPDDGGHHENAHGLADDVLKRVAVRKAYEAADCRLAQGV